MKAIAVLLFGLLSMTCFGQVKETVRFLRQYLDSLEGNFVVSEYCYPWHLDIADIRWIKEGCKEDLRIGEIDSMIKGAMVDTEKIFLADTGLFSRVKTISSKDERQLPIGSILIIDKKTGDTTAETKKMFAISRKYGDPNIVYSCSKPIFNASHTYAIFESSMYCGGTCGNFSIELYKMEDGRWKFVMSLYAVDF